MASSIVKSVSWYEALDAAKKNYLYSKPGLNQCTNAKKYALTEYEKSIDEHYFMLRSYGKAIFDSNPGSTVNLGVTVNLDGKTYFDSPNQGEILTAIRRDGNNHIYPVAWAVVNIENNDNWTWFLELLEEDLGCSRGNRLTLMFDQRKVGEKYTSVAQFKECLTYYGQENGFSLWYERSGEVRVVAKCG
nr:hypothetical protein [Tanacetum cinerariifolium]